MTNPGFKRVLNYLWDSEPANVDHEHEIACLGVKYSPKVLVCEDHERDISQTTQWPPEFLEDVESKVWLTYRTNFALIPKAKDGPSPLSLGSILRGSAVDLSGFTSDVGWGCMIRTSQSLLANALVLLKLGREWRRSDELLRDREAEIVSLFRDEPDAAFSLHNFVKHGELACGKMPGEWFGPSAAASSIKHLCDKNGILQVYISQGSDLYASEFLSVARASRQFKPTLILLGLRLGIDNVNSLYWDSLKQFFNSPQIVGIAGGRPSASHYFYGYQNDNLFYLDPHTPRPKLEAPITREGLETVHTKRIRLLALDQMDPSMLVGFLVRNEADWQEWRAMIETQQRIVHIAQSAPMILRRSSISIDDVPGFVDIALEEGECLDNDDNDNGDDDNKSISGSNIQESISIEMPQPDSPVMVSCSIGSEYQLANAPDSDDDFETPVMLSSSTTSNPSPAMQDRDRRPGQEPVYVDSPVHDDSEWEDMRR